MYLPMHGSHWFGGHTCDRPSLSQHIGPFGRGHAHLLPEPRVQTAARSVTVGGPWTNRYINILAQSIVYLIFSAPVFHVGGLSPPNFPRVCSLISISNQHWLNGPPPLPLLLSFICSPASSSSSFSCFFPFRSFISYSISLFGYFVLSLFRCFVHSFSLLLFRSLFLFCYFVLSPFFILFVLSLSFIILWSFFISFFLSRYFVPSFSLPLSFVLSSSSLLLSLLLLSSPPEGGWNGEQGLQEDKETGSSHCSLWRLCQRK